MSGICAGRVVIITGAGRGLGRVHALAFAHGPPRSCSAPKTSFAPPWPTAWGL